MEVPDDHLAEKIQIGPKKKIAFVCSGGAAKAGAFHLGVALALQEQGFKFLGGLNSSFQGGLRKPGPMEISTYVGSSAGAVISSYLAAGYSLYNIFNSFLGRKPDPFIPEDLLPKILPRLTYQKLYKVKPSFAKDQLIQFIRLKQTLSDIVEGNWESLIQFKWLKATGIFSTSGVEQYMREEVLPSNQFQDYVADLFIVATQLNYSRKVVFGKYNYQPPPQEPNCHYDDTVGISDACAASIALPVIFAPHAIKDKNGQIAHYIDGEIRDTLSTHVAIDGNADLVIASYTHQPYHFLEEEGKSLTDYGLSAIVIQSIYLLIEQKINNHVFSKEAHRNAINAVSAYCKSQGLSRKHRDKICQILEFQLNHRMDVDTLYIHPNPTDSQLFFGDHFTLSPRKMTDIVKSGFRAAIETLRQYEFADRKRKPAIGMTDAQLG